MCGIAGVIDPGGRSDVRPILKGLAHRGPDGVGTATVGPTSVGAVRLALRDPAHGAQPFSDPEHGVAIIFNGEIYNDLMLRDRLAARGHRFRTRCDTETVLRAWIEWGPDATAMLEGMFAFAILESRRLILVRDAYGIKPLYYFHGGRRGPFLFASEIPALLSHPAVERALDLQGMADFVALGTVTECDTLFHGVKTLAPGGILTITWENGFGIELRRWRSVESDQPDPALLGPEVIASGLGNALQDAVVTHLVADSPVAVLLSGGLDSTALALMAAEALGRPPDCFTVADSIDHPDLVAATKVASDIGAPHSVRLPTFADYLAALPHTIRATAMPDCGPGPLFLDLCRQVAHTHKAALVGEGADEALCGYPVFLEAASVIQPLNRGFERAARTGLHPSDRAHVIRLDLERAAGDAVQFHRTLRNVYMREQLVRCHLEPVDHVSMAASIEVRVPFLASEVARWSSIATADPRQEVSSGTQKLALRTALSRRFGAVAAPAVQRTKIQMPEAGRLFDRRFDTLCTQALAASLEVSTDAADCFATDAERVHFQLFHDIHLKSRWSISEILEQFLSLIGKDTKRANNLI